MNTCSQHHSEIAKSRLQKRSATACTERKSPQVQTGELEMKNFPEMIESNHTHRRTCGSKVDVPQIKQKP